MNSIYSKAFLLGKNLVNVLLEDIGEPSTPETVAMTRRLVSTLSKALGVDVGDVRPLKGADDSINELRQRLRFDLSVLHSEYIANCFDLGFEFAFWLAVHGGYPLSSESMRAPVMQMEARLRARVLAAGLDPAIFDKCISIAKNPSIPLQEFFNAGAAVVISIMNLLDARTQAQPTEKTQAIIEAASTSIFIVMPMLSSDPGLVDVHDSIRVVAQSLGLKAYRVDDLETSGRITDSILEGLRNAAAIVVDLTHSRPNVYYEAGYAHGLGKIPIYIARSGTALEFDVKDYPVIFYENMKALRDRLSRRLKKQLNPPGALGQPSEAASSP